MLEFYTSFVIRAMYEDSSCQCIMPLQSHCKFISMVSRFAIANRNWVAAYLQQRVFSPGLHFDSSKCNVVLVADGERKDIGAVPEVIGVQNF